MEFTKTSNVGPLIAAVLVGLLAICTDHAFMKPEDIDRILRGFNRSSAETSGTPTVVSQLENPKLLSQKLLAGYEALTGASQGKRNGKPVNAKGLAKLVAQLNEASIALYEHPHATDAQKSQGQLNYLRALFLAAEMAPADHSDTFRDFGNRILAQGNVTDPGKVRLLLAYHECSGGRIAEDLPGLLDRLAAFSKRETDQATAIDVYSLLSDELFSRGQPIAAMKVLQQGRAIYFQHPGKRKLNERLIDLQMKMRR
jgi:hypothetical protein